jgi:hypothetical protein
MVPSRGRTTSTPYTMKKGVSPVAWLGDVRFPHSVHGSSSIHLYPCFFKPSYVQSLETIKDFCVGSLHLAIALWVSNGRITKFPAKIFTVLLECAAGEMGAIVCDDPVWDPKPVDDGLDELDY